MERFENAQVGDLVYCRLGGNGKIIEIKQGSMMPIHVNYPHRLPCNGIDYESYSLDGKIHKSNTEPVLFYRKGKERYLTKQPEPDVDWATVAPGTVCFVANNPNEMELQRMFLCFLDGEKWFANSVNKSATTWNYARIK